jgi:hypothetical protein
MNGAGNPLNYDYRDPRHVERYAKLVVRNPDAGPSATGRPCVRRSGAGSAP